MRHFEREFQAPNLSAAVMSPKLNGNISLMSAPAASIHVNLPAAVAAQGLHGDSASPTVGMPVVAYAGACLGLRGGTPADHPAGGGGGAEEAAAKGCGIGNASAGASSEGRPSCPTRSPRAPSRHSPDVPLLATPAAGCKPSFSCSSASVVAEAFEEASAGAASSGSSSKSLTGCCSGYAVSPKPRGYFSQVQSGVNAIAISASRPNSSMSGMFNADSRSCRKSSGVLYECPPQRSGVTQREDHLAMASAAASSCSRGTGKLRSPTWPSALLMSNDSCFS